MATFTNSEISASTVTCINKKTNADGSFLGFACKIIDGDGNHYSVILHNIDAGSDKSAVKAALKSYLLTANKTPVHESTSSSFLLSEDDANESLS